MKKKTRFFLAARSVAVLAVLCLAFSVLVGRLVYLQIVQNSTYKAKVSAEQIQDTELPALRGSIYDRNMVTLAQSAMVWDVVASPKYFKNDAQRKAAAQNLAKPLGMTEDALYKKLQGSSAYVVLVKKVEKQTADTVEAYLKKANIGCIALQTDSRRYYPFGNFASQLIGFTGSAGQGLSGVEAEYDSVLTGTPGKSIAAKNPSGGNIPNQTETDIPAQNGDNLVLTIDETVQEDLESNLRQALVTNNVANRATGIVMDVKTGEILAMATVPGYDPNDPFAIADSTAKAKLAALSGSAYKTALAQAQQVQWRNKAISEPYEPGSTFKIITASAALNENVVKETDPFYDPGQIDVDGQTFHCWLEGGHGHETFLQGFENSCNVVFIEVGQRLGVANFCKYFASFGLTEKTGIDLPGEANSIYIRQSAMGPVELASSSFGQSNKITPIQLITAVSAAANGGTLVQPHVVKEELDENGNVVKTFGTTAKRQVISAQTSAEIDQMMEDEVSQGTGKNAYVAGYRVGGKTGTGQKLDSTDPNALVASFVGVAPSDDPQVALLVVLDEPHASNNFGGVIAAPVAGNIFSEILPYLGVEPKYSASELAALDIKTPDLSGMTLAAAKAQLGAQGLQPNVYGGGATVTAQVPSAGSPIPHGGRVSIYTGGAVVQNSVTVPSLQGMTPSQAYRTLTALGLNADFEGTKVTDSGVTAYEQGAAEKTKVPVGTVVTVKFRNENIRVR